jgi:hypothetical protein
LITHGAPYHSAWAEYETDHALRSLIATVAGEYATDPNYTRLAESIASRLNVLKAIAAAKMNQPDSPVLARQSTDAPSQSNSTSSSHSESLSAVFGHPGPTL